MLKTIGIDHVNIQVQNLQESYQFYKKLFGFEILKNQPEENSYIIGNENTKICLYEVSNLPKYNRSNGGFNHFSIIVENFDDVLELCKKLGVYIWHGGHIVKWEKSRSIYIDDPNGYNIEIGDVWGGGLTE
ncbi:VOC family protein [uncultured Aquimarina sp.]|uniref:VOC family protein n=1 Tax=uncultured Aquimarina sp. TaxID=575652 RepID=UPI00261C71FD|nr:VOC family protein [uncultured Aquimarina sp.]